MSIISELKKIRLVMRKENPKAYATLSNVIGDFELKSKLKSNLNSPEDELALRVVRLEIAHLNEQISTLSDNAEIESILGAIEILKTVLPSIIPNDKVKELAEHCKKDGMTFPLFMKYMKDNYTGRFDGKETSLIAKRIF